MGRPNILIITCHDLGDFVDVYGHPIGTPSLTAMAEAGVVLENHFSTSAVCSPARGAIMTGCYPHTNGLMGLVHRGWALDTARMPTIPMLLADGGYETHLFGFQHEHYDPARLGYQAIHRRTGRAHCENVAPVFIEWLEGRDASKPFFAAMGFSETHRLDLPSHFKRDVYEPADPSAVRVPPWLPDVPEVRAELGDFYGAVRHVDRTVGAILDALQRCGAADDTLVLFTTDHGASFPHGKATLYDGGTKVAALLRWPAGAAAGHRVGGLTSHADVLPTLLDLLELPVPAHVQGRSLASAVRGETDEHRELVFAEKNYTNYFDPARFVRSGRLKYIRKGLATCIFDFVIPELERCPTSFLHSRAVRRFYSARRCREELYDLTADPGELDNRIEDPACAEALTQLRGALDAHLEATDDPFRHLRNDLLMPEHTYTEVFEARGR
jgi:arylsulfatase A-like enzyme